MSCKFVKHTLCTLLSTLLVALSIPACSAEPEGEAFFEGSEAAIDEQTRQLFQTIVEDDETFEKTMAIINVVAIQENCVPAYDYSSSADLPALIDNTEENQVVMKIPCMGGTRGEENRGVVIVRAERHEGSGYEVTEIIGQSHDNENSKLKIYRHADSTGQLGLTEIDTEGRSTEDVVREAHLIIYDEELPANEEAEIEYEPAAEPEDLCSPGIVERTGDCNACQETLARAQLMIQVSNQVFRPLAFQWLTSAAATFFIGLAAALLDGPLPIVDIFVTLPAIIIADIEILISLAYSSMGLFLTIVGLYITSQLQPRCEILCDPETICNG